MTQTVKITVSIAEEYEYIYQDKTETRTRDKDIYMQIVEVSGEPGDDAARLVAQLSEVVNNHG